MLPTEKTTFRRKRRKEQRPREILEAALKLFLAHGYSATRMDDVAASAGAMSSGHWMPPPETTMPQTSDARLSDLPFRGIVEQSLAGIYVIQDEVFEYVNATFAAIVGYRPAEMVGMHLRQVVPPECERPRDAVR